MQFLFNGLYAKEKDGTPIIDAWLNKYGMKDWLQLLIQKSDNTSYTSCCRAWYRTGITWTKYDSSP